MTQNTQTTTERITALIFDAIRMDSTTFETVDAECATIAAEIDGLRDEMAVILRERNDAHLALAEARAEVERLRPAAEAWNTLEEFREAQRTGTEDDEQRTRDAHKAARDRARAAKGSA